MTLSAQSLLRNSTSLLGIGLLTALVSAPLASAQVGITAATFGVLSDDPDTVLDGITYQGQTLPFAGVDAGGKNWSFAGVPTPITRLVRADYGAPADDLFGNYASRSSVWGFRNPGTSATTIRPGLLPNADQALGGNNALAGVNNVFTNAGFAINGVASPSQTNIERMDLIFPSGVVTSSEIAAVFFDRGGLTNHDGFQIAPILSLDGSNNPASYGNLLTVATGWGQTNLLPGGGSTDNLPFTELTDETTVFTVALSTLSQQIGGVAIPLSDLAGTGTTIFGYSLFGLDVNPAGNLANLLDVNNATVFPQLTPASQGGLDLVSGSGRLVVTAVPEPGNMALLVGLAVVGSLRLRRRK